MTDHLCAEEAQALIVRHLDAVEKLWKQVKASAPPRRGSGGLLTRQQLRVARMYAWSRQSLREIARELFISENTAKSHMKAVYAKLGVRHRGELAGALMAVERARVDALGGVR